MPPVADPLLCSFIYRQFVFTVIQCIHIYVLDFTCYLTTVYMHSLDITWAFYWGRHVMGVIQAKITCSFVAQKIRVCQFSNPTWDFTQYSIIMKPLNFLCPVIVILVLVWPPLAGPRFVKPVGVPCSACAQCDIWYRVVSVWLFGKWLDILWCSVCLCLTFVTFFVKKYFFSAYQL